MILFKDDWYKPENETCIVDTQTSNKSFLRLAGIYKAKGVENFNFMLALHNPLLQGVDPFDEENLTTEQIAMIAVECKLNPWYVLREIILAPNSGMRFKANRANIGFIWLVLNHITTLLIQPRQTGKSFSSDAIVATMMYLAGEDLSAALYTKDEKLRTSNVKRIKAIMDGFPKYLKVINKKDVRNNEAITVNDLGNSYMTFIAQASIKAARDIGRGETLAVIQVDEAGHLKNNKESLPTLLAAGNAGRDIAEVKGGFYANIFTTTAARLDDPSGKYFYDEFYMGGALWSEKFFDLPDQKSLKKIVEKHSTGYVPLVVLDFNHRQLGYTDKWLVDKMKETVSKGIEAEIDYLCKWSRGNDESPISPQDLEKIDKSTAEDRFDEISDKGYITRWYVRESEIESLKSRPLVLAIDTSDAVGKDDIALVLRDVKTGEVLAAGNYNETNLVVFAKWLLDWLVRFPKLVMIPERRSSCVVIIDYLLDLCPKMEIDPFKRIFNWVVNKIEMNEIMRRQLSLPLEQRDPVIYVKYRKEFGYATSGSGRSSRDNLYGANLLAAVKYTGDTVRDRMLIQQISTLVVRNGRIDHSISGKDDMVITWLLSYYFLTNVKNADYYGINPKDLLSELITKSDDVENRIEAKIKDQEQKEIKQMINYLLEMLNQKDNNDLRIFKIKKKLIMLNGMLEPNNRVSLNIETELQDKKDMDKILKMVS